MEPSRYYTLRFDSFEQARAVCQALGYWQTATSETPEGPIPSGQVYGPDGIRGFCIDVIGDDPILFDGAQLDGCYVNVAGLLPAAAQPFEVPYGSAGRVFQEVAP